MTGLDDDDNDDDENVDIYWRQYVLILMYIFKKIQSNQLSINITILVICNQVNQTVKHNKSCRIISLLRNLVNNWMCRLVIFFLFWVVSIFIVQNKKTLIEGIRYFWGCGGEGTLQTLLTLLFSLLVILWVLLKIIK